MAMEKCSVCREWVFTGGTHKCAPRWDCRFVEGGPIYADGEWEPVHAYDDETAAEKFCERYDCEGGEYAVLNAGDRNPPTVEVRDRDGTVKLFRVVGETIPQYRADQITA